MPAAIPASPTKEGDHAMIRENIEELMEADAAESVLRKLDKGVSRKSGISLFHILTAASIVASIALFVRGRKMEAIFVGLWPPTFQALKSAAYRRS
jgi:hypothetical protein